jgi:hypothetical protein
MFLRATCPYVDVYVIVRGVDVGLYLSNPYLSPSSLLLASSQSQPRRRRLTFFTYAALTALASRFTSKRRQGFEFTPEPGSPPTLHSTYLRSQYVLSTPYASQVLSGTYLHASVLSGTYSTYIPPRFRTLRYVPPRFSGTYVLHHTASPVPPTLAYRSPCFPCCALLPHAVHA